MQAMWTRHEDGVEVLLYVLRCRAGAPFQPHLPGPTVHCQMLQLQRPVDAVHALLSLVPTESDPRLEDREVQGEVLILQLGGAPRLLGVLPVVHKLPLGPWSPQTVRGEKSVGLDRSHLGVNWDQGVWRKLTQGVESLPA